MGKKRNKQPFSRRQFLKLSGAAGALAGVGGLGLYGYQAGKDPSSYTGWKTFEGGDQYFNRNRFAVDKPTYDKVGPTRRIDARTEVIFSRSPTLMRNWDENKGLESLPDYLRAYYEEHPEDLELDLYNYKELFPKLRADRAEYGDLFILSEAWSHAMGAVHPDRITDPPKVFDFPSKRQGYMGGDPTTPYRMKSPEMTSKLIKKIGEEIIFIPYPEVQQEYKDMVEGMEKAIKLLQ